MSKDYRFNKQDWMEDQQLSVVKKSRVKQQRQIEQQRKQKHNSESSLTV